MHAVAQEARAPADGRLARRLSTRAAVVDALLALLEAGDLRPPAPRIAARAGVSLRSVFQHFSDLESLYAAAADRQTARLRALVRPIPPAGPLPARLRAFIAQRSRLLEALSPVRRAALLLEPFSPEIAARLRQARALKRAEVARVFAPELARQRSAAARRALRAALGAAGSWTNWEALRVHQGLSAAHARAALTHLFGALLRQRETRQRRS